MPVPHNMLQSKRPDIPYLVKDSNTIQPEGHNV